MPTATLTAPDGRTATVDLGGSFDSLPSDQQQQSLHDISQQVFPTSGGDSSTSNSSSSGPSGSPAANASGPSFDLDGARKSGATDQQLAQFLSSQPSASSSSSTTPQASSQPAPSSDTSLLGAAKQGLADVVHGVGSTARVLGATDAAKTIDSYAPDVPNYSRATGSIASDLRAGNYRDALGYLPRAAVEGGAALAGGLAAGGAAAALAPEAAGAGAAALGGAAFTAATGLGSNVEAHAANDGRSADELTASDYLAGGLTTAGQAALAGVGLRPGVVPAVGRAMARSTAARVGANVLGDAAAGAGNSVIGQVGQTAGTEKGVTVDPAEVAAAGAQAGASRLSSESPAIARAAGRATVAGRNAVADRAIGSAPASDDAAASIVRTDQAVKDVQAQSPGKMDYTAASGVVADRLASHVSSMASALADGDVGGLSKQEVQSAIKPLIDAARDPNVDALATAKDGQTPTPMDTFQALDLPDAIKTGFVQSVADLQTATQAANATPGKAFRTIGGLAGQAVGLGAAAHGVAPLEAVASLIGGHKGVAGHVGSAVGGAVGNVLTGNRNPVQAAVGRAQGMLPDGLPPMSSLSKAQAFSSQLNDPQAATRLSLGLTAQPDGAPVDVTAPNELGSSTMTPAQMAKGSALQEAAANQLSGMVKKASDRAAAQKATDDAKQAQADADAAEKTRGDVIQQAMQQARAEEAMRQRGMALNEQAANRLQGQLYRQSQDARQAGVVGASAIGPQDPASIFQRSNGLAGSPMGQSALGVDGVTAPVPGQPAGVSEPAVVQAARAKVNPRAAALMSQRGLGDVGAQDITPTATPASQPAQAAPTALPSGWRSYVQRGIQTEAGYRPTSAELDAAVDQQTLAGHLDPVIAQAMKRSNASIHAASLQGVIAQALVNAGHGHRLTSDAPPVVQAAASGVGQGQQDVSAGPTATPSAAPQLPSSVRDPLRWNAARADVQRHVEATAQAADARGDHALAQAVRSIGVEKTEAGKAKIAAAFLASLGSPKTPADRLRLGLAQQALGDATLLRGV